MIQPYKTLVKPQLKYCVQFWSPYCRKDAIKLARVKKRLKEEKMPCVIRRDWIG